MKPLTLTSILILFSSLVFTQDKVVEPFLPQIFSQFPNVRDIAISSAGDEIYFSVQSYADEVSFIAGAKRNNNKWSEPEIVNFSGKYFDIEPFLSADGLKLYYASNRPLDNTNDKTKDFDIWYVERENKNAEWSRPINLGEPVNSPHNEFFPCLSSKSNLYFTSDNPMGRGKDDIFFSLWNKNRYESPGPLGDSINTDGYEFNAFVAPDESYIIYTAYQREGGFGSGDLYMSIKDSDGIWAKAKNLGAEINSNKMDYCPYVDTKTNTLYFTSKRSEINNSNIGYSSVKDFLNDMKKYKNGLSRIYKTNLK